MAPKRDLKASAKRGVRKPRAERQKSVSQKKRGYRVVGVSYYTDEADFLERIVTILREAGVPRATRSYVSQRMLHFFAAELADKTPDQVVGWFAENEANLALRFQGNADNRF